MFEQKGERLVNGFGVHQVVIIENQHHLIGKGGQLVEQRGQQHVAGRRLRRLEQPQQPFPDLRRNALQGSNKIGQKTAEIAIAFIQRQPSHLRIYEFRITRPTGTRALLTIVISA